jgi:TonB family protein
VSFETDFWMALALDSVLKGAVILSLAWLMAIAAKRSSAAVRHLIWTVAILGCVSVPVLEAILPHWQVAHSITVLPGKIARVPVQNSATSTGTQAATVSQRPQFDWTRWLLIAWCGGVTLVGMWSFVGVVQLRIVAARARQSTSEAILEVSEDVQRQYGIERRVSVLQTAKVTMPLTYGVWNPLILLPACASSWAPARLRAVLLHEFGHVKRWDWLTQTIAQLACALYWFNPLVWIAASRMRREREHACDDAVLSVGVRGTDYAEHLVFIARSMSHEQGILTASAAMAQPSQLEGRVKAVLNTGVSRTSITRKRALLASVAAAVLLVPVAAVRSVAQSSSTGTISGVVMDASGKNVVSAVVIATNLDKSNREVTATGDAGDFEFKSIPAGRYVVEVRKQGFAPNILKEMTLAPGSALRSNVTLQIGSVSETLDVVAQSPMAGSRNGETKRISVGGNVQATKLVKMVRPPYPESAKAAGIEGPVVMKAVIGKAGDLLSLEVVNTLANPELAKAAKEAVSQWKYAPTLLNGDPVEVITRITVNYKLQPQE